jgi:hypothetical protein
MEAVSGLFVKVPEREFIDAGGWMASGDGFECCLKVGVWLYAVQLAGLDKRRDAGPCSATFVMAHEQRVFPVEGKRHRETPWGVILPPIGIDPHLRHSRVLINAVEAESAKQLIWRQD